MPAPPPASPGSLPEPDIRRVEVAYGIVGLNLALIPAVVVTFLLGVAAFFALWPDGHVDALRARGAGNLLAVPLLLLLIYLHERIHYETFRLLGGLRREDLVLGVHWRLLTPYVHVKRPVPIRAYRASLLAPFVLLGVLPLVLALARADLTLLVVAVIMWCASYGDLAVWIRLLSLPTGALCEDHPTKAGCVVTWRPPQRNHVP